MYIIQYIDNIYNCVSLSISGVSLNGTWPQAYGLYSPSWVDLVQPLRHPGFHPNAREARVFPKEGLPLSCRLLRCASPLPTTS